MEIDFSKTLLAAATQVFQGGDVLAYMNTLWEAMTGKLSAEKKKSIFAIHICRFHVLRFFMSKVKRVYGNRKQQLENVQKVWTAWINSFVRAKDLYSLNRRITDFFYLAGTEKIDDTVQDILNNMSSPTKKLVSSQKRNEIACKQ